VSLLGQPSAVPIRLGQTLSGRLERTDHEGVTGYEDYYAVQGSPGDTVTIYVESDEIDPAVASGGMSDGPMFFDDYDADGGPGTNAALVTVVGGPEPYYVMVHSFVPCATGAYTLRMEAGAHPGPPGYAHDEWPGSAQWQADSVLVTDEVYSDSAAVDTTIAPTTAAVPWPAADADSMASGLVDLAAYTARPVNADGWVVGTLDEVRQDEEGRYFEHFTYTARAGERLRISVTAEHLDTSVAIGTGTYLRFEPLAQDESSGREWNPELEWTAPESGEYIIRVSGAFPGEAGVFTLRVRSIP
jgi:hypothetical protein